MVVHGITTRIEFGSINKYKAYEKCEFEIKIFFFKYLNIYFKNINTSIFMLEYMKLIKNVNMFKIILIIFIISGEDFAKCGLKYF